MTQNLSGMEIENWYYGKILTGDYSRDLQGRVVQYLDVLKPVDRLELPAMVYLAAWKSGKETIWYEFASQSFCELLDCKPEELAGAFRNSVIDRRVFRYTNVRDDVGRDVIGKAELSATRKQLRRKTKQEGHLEAVYKILPQQGRAVWLKDHARIESYPEDGISLSLGSMAVISKEMEAVEEKERLIKKLEASVSDLQAGA